MNDLSRRDLLKKGALVGAAGVAVSFLAYCKKKAVEEPMAEMDACSDLSSLTAAEKEMRTTLKYADKSDKADTCAGCQFFTAGTSACGKCTILKGPIMPGGWCASWAKKVG
ncbi:MAG: high-potential iron-sulfur protein [Spirochaetia bacterium]|nr:high-potential iron-sulfur protein [Spirochaetia bacterium]